MPHITVDMFPGRTEEQKQRFAQLVSALAVGVLGCGQQHVSVAICETEPDHWETQIYQKKIKIMIRNPITSSPNRTILQAIEIMKGNKVDSLLVVDNNDILIGIVTSKDIQGNITSSSVKLGSIMTKDLIYAKTDDSIGEILKIMNKNNVGFVPIVDENGCLKGLVTKSSLITLFEEKLLYEVV